MSTIIEDDDQKVTLALMRHVVATKGVGLEWLDDNDRSDIAAALSVGGRAAIEQIADVLDRRVTAKIVSAFIKEHNVL